LRKILDIVATLIIFGSIAILVTWMGRGLETEYTGKVVVIDGDSVIVEGEKIRLEGIDAPEFKQMCRSKRGEYSCGRESRNYLTRLISNKQFYCKAWQRDKYERLLGRCFVGEVDINAQMVLSGWAVSFGGYFGEEAKARKAKAGIWAGEFERPGDWRHQRGSVFELPHGMGQNKWWKFW